MAHTLTAQQQTINHLEKQPVPRQDASTRKMPLKFSKVVIRLQKMIQSARKGISKSPSQLLETSIQLVQEFFRL